MSGFVSEDAFHFLFVCPVALQNAPLCLRTLLHGSDDVAETKNMEIINETLKFIKDSKRFELC